MKNRLIKKIIAAVSSVILIAGMVIPNIGTIQAEVQQLKVDMLENGIVASNIKSYFNKADVTSSNVFTGNTFRLVFDLELNDDALYDAKLLEWTSKD